MCTKCGESFRSRREVYLHREAYREQGRTCCPMKNVASVIDARHHNPFIETR